jgi:hypothetical protein
LSVDCFPNIAIGPIPKLLDNFVPANKNSTALLKVLLEMMMHYLLLQKPQLLQKLQTGLYAVLCDQHVQRGPLQRVPVHSSA